MIRAKKIITCSLDRAGRNLAVGFRAISSRQINESTWVGDEPGVAARARVHEGRASAVVGGDRVALPVVLVLKNCRSPPLLVVIVALPAVLPVKNRVKPAVVGRDRRVARRGQVLEGRDPAVVGDRGVAGCAKGGINW